MGDTQKNEENPTQPDEDKQQEEPVEEEVREEIASELSLDPEEQSDLLDKLTKREVERRQELGKAIRQKIEWREKAKQTSQKEESKGNTQESSTDVKATIREEIERMELEKMDVPKEIKEDIQRVAKLNGQSVRDAAQDPYIKHKLEQVQRSQKNEEASISRTGKPSPVQANLNEPPKFDYSTEEGRKEAKKWREKVKQQGEDRA